MPTATRAMYTKPKRTDFVKDNATYVTGFVMGGGSILYGGKPIPAYRVQTATGVKLILQNQTIIINRDGYPWADWLRHYRAGRIKN